MASSLHALDVSYGKFLKITGIKQQAEKLILPVERRKYHNIRILDKETYQRVRACSSSCVQQVEKFEAKVQEVRAASTRPDMWIVSVSFNRQWLITFLVFRNGEQYRVKSPVNLVFLQQDLRKRIERDIVVAVKEL